MKRLTSIILAAFLCISNAFAANINAGAEAEDTKLKYGDYLFYEQVDKDKDGTYDSIVISDCDESAEEITIPPDIDGLPVTKIDGVAFYECGSMKSVEIPDSVTYIGRYAFYNCKSLEILNIPDNVDYIGYSVFKGCTGLTSINVSDGNKAFVSVDGILFNKMQTNLICCPANKSIEGYTIPDGVKSISESAFSKCTNLTSVSIPDSVTSIESYAFSGCGSLKSIKIPDSVTELGHDVFTSTPLLSESDPVKYVDKWLVKCSQSVSKVSIKSGTRGIAESAFSGSSTLKSIEIPNGVTSICGSAFSNCNNLENVKLPSSVTLIGDRAFFNTALLNNQKGVKYVGKWAVDCDEDVENAVIKAGTKGIASYALYRGKFKTVRVPSSVTMINSMAFPYSRYIYLNENSKTLEYAKKYGCSYKILGDANADNKLSIKDSRFIAVNVAQRRQTEIPEWADYNGDGKRSIKDARDIAIYIAKGRK